MTWLIASFWLIGVLVTNISGVDKENGQKTPKLAFCDVGQGDATLISDGNWQALIDGGPDDSILYCLSQEMPTNDKTIELLVLTHADADHLSGFISILQSYQIKKILIDNTFKETTEFMKFYNLVWEKNKNNEIEIVSPVLAQFWCETEKICLQILWHNPQNLPEDIFSYKYEFSELSDMLKKSYQNEIDYNYGSIVVNFTIDHKNVMITGDIDKAAELAILEGGLIKKIDVLKIAHHGSKTSSSIEFLTKTQPEFSVISAGRKNKFGHPNNDVLERLQTIKSQILRTDELGTIHFSIKNGNLEPELVKQTNKWWMSW